MNEVVPQHLRGGLVDIHAVMLIFGYTVQGWVGFGFYFPPMHVAGSADPYWASLLFRVTSTLLIGSAAAITRPNLRLETGCLAERIEFVHDGVAVRARHEARAPDAVEGWHRGGCWLVGRAACGVLAAR